jgi:hypothetical protein
MNAEAIQKLNAAAREFMVALRDFQDNTDVDVEVAIEDVDYMVEQLVIGVEV